MIAIGPHFSSNNVFDEVDACLQCEKDSADIIKKQVNMFKRLSFSGDYMNGRFYETNIIYRQHHNKLVVKIMNDWWWWIKNYSYRDQLSLIYSLWKHNVSVPLLTNRTYREGNRVKYNYGENHITLSEAKSQIARLSQNITTIMRVIEEKDKIINSLLGSLSWRVTRPLRQIDAVVRKLRYLMVASAQRIYDATPLPPQIRTPITNFVFTYFAIFFKGTDPYEQWLDTIHSGIATDQSKVVPIETSYGKVPDSVDKITGLRPWQGHVSYHNPPK
jgi:TOD1/MUCI70, glycosyltransferase-like domain